MDGDAEKSAYQPSVFHVGVTYFQTLAQFIAFAQLAPIHSGLISIRSPEQISHSDEIVIAYTAWPNSEQRDAISTESVSGSCAIRAPPRRLSGARAISERRLA